MLFCEYFDILPSKPNINWKPSSKMAEDIAKVFVKLIIKYSTVNLQKMLIKYY